MARLIYHPISQVGATSPFDHAILQVARGSAVKIVSPYVGLSYLDRIIKASNGQWALISDVEAWLSSLSFKARLRAWSFIRDNSSRIHHCPAIHAKTVIGEALALLGSANLTSMGILARTELGVLLDDSHAVQDLHAWFDGLWTQSGAPVADETNAYVQWLDRESRDLLPARRRPILSSNAPMVAARLAPFEQSPEVGYDLEPIAKTVVETQEQQRAMLAHMVTDLISHMPDSTTLAQIVDLLAGQSRRIPVADIYSALLMRCANHPRTAYHPEGDCALVLLNRKFARTTPDLLGQAIAPFDEFLVYVVQNLDFDIFRPLTYLPLPASRRQIDFDRQLEALINAEFLESIEQSGNSGYRLNEEFNWSGRYRLFARAKRAWQDRAPKARIAAAPATPEQGSRSPANSGPTKFHKSTERLPIERPTPITAPAHTRPALATNAPETSESQPIVGARISSCQTAESLQSSNTEELPEAHSLSGRTIEHNVLWQLVNLIRSRGTSMRFSSLDQLSLAIKRATGLPHYFKIKAVLEGHWHVPCPFEFVFTDDAYFPCEIFLTPWSDDAWSGLIEIRRALDQLDPRVLAELHHSPEERAAYRRQSPVESALGVPHPLAVTDIEQRRLRLRAGLLGPWRTQMGLDDQIKMYQDVSSRPVAPTEGQRG